MHHSQRAEHFPSPEVSSFNTEPRKTSCNGCCDYLEINGVRYCGSQGPDVVHGLLTITVVKGKDVRGRGDNCEGTYSRDCLDTDPYVKVSVNGQRDQTASKDDTDQPVWNKVMHFGGQPTGAEITVELWDADNNADDHMGTNTFSVPERTGDFELFVQSGEGQGTIRLRVTFDVDVAHRGAPITWYSDKNSGGTGWELCWPHDTPPSPEVGVDCNCATKKTTIGGDCTCYSCGGTSECDANKCDVCGAPVGDCTPCRPNTADATSTTTRRQCTLGAFN